MTFYSVKKRNYTNCYFNVGKIVTKKKLYKCMGLIIYIVTIRINTSLQNIFFKHIYH